MQNVLFTLYLAATGEVSCGDSTNCTTGLPIVPATTNQLQTIFQIVFGIFGAVAVFMIVIGGLRFISAQGNPQEVAKARNTIIYAVIGLIVMMAAEGIVSFVLFKASTV